MAFPKSPIRRPYFNQSMHGGINSTTENNRRWQIFSFGEREGQLERLPLYRTTNQCRGRWQITQAQRAKGFPASVYFGGHARSLCLSDLSATLTLIGCSVQWESLKLPFTLPERENLSATVGFGCWVDPSMHGLIEVWPTNRRFRERHKGVEKSGRDEIGSKSIIEVWFGRIFEKFLILGDLRRLDSGSVVWKCATFTLFKTYDFQFSRSLSICLQTTPKPAIDTRSDHYTRSLR